MRIAPQGWIKKVGGCCGIDWRVPTAEEVNGLANCIDRGGFDPESAIALPSNSGGEFKAFNKCRRNDMGSDFSDRGPAIATREIFPNRWYNSHWLASPAGEKKWIASSEEGFRSSDRFLGQPAILVRGGKPADFYTKLVADAATHERRVAAEKEESARQAHQKAADIERQNQAFRNSIKPGDMAAQGLVLEVKGELVRVQTYRYGCAVYHGTTCLRMDNVVAGEEWIRRAVLRPGARR